MFGASIYDYPPFVVMPLMQYGDALKYLQDFPHADRLRLVSDAEDEEAICGGLH